MAAGQGLAEAQFLIGAVISEKVKTLKNEELHMKDALLEAAMGWYRKAAAQGYASAQFTLGRLFEKGLGVSSNKEMAYMWYKLGAENGSTLGTKRREKIEEEMTSEQVAKAEELAQECMKKNYKGCGS